MPNREPGPWAAVFVLVVIVVLGLIFASCAGAQGVQPPPDSLAHDWGAKRVKGRTPIEPTPMHIAIYEMMEGCTGISGDPDRVHWSMAWSIEDAETGEIKASMWSGTDGYRQIILAKEWAFSGHYISHEVLHDLYDGPAPMDTAMRCLFFWWNLREARP